MKRHNGKDTRVGVDAALSSPFQTRSKEQSLNQGTELGRQTKCLGNRKGLTDRDAVKEAVMLTALKF